MRDHILLKSIIILNRSTYTVHQIKNSFHNTRIFKVYMLQINEYQYQILVFIIIFYEL